MGLNHFGFLFLLGFINFSIGKECLEDLDINDPKILSYLTRKLDQLNNVTPEGTTNDKEIQFIRLIRAQKKGVESYYEFEAKGLKTNAMYVCNLMLFRQFDAFTEKITKYSCNLVSDFEKRLLPGEDIVVDVKGNNDLEELKSFLGLEISKTQRSKYLMTVMKYLKATVQIVEGMLLKTTVQVGLTNCYLYDNCDANDCQKKLQGHQVCDVKVWLKPWMKYKEVIEVQCQALKPTFCAGCPIEKDPNNPFIKQYLEKTLYKLNQESQPDQKLILVKINKATSQVLNGVRITIYFDAQKSNRNYTCKTIIALPPSSKEHVIEDFTCTPFAVN